MSLFKDGMMRKADKPSLRKLIMPDESSFSKKGIITDKIVMDGGALVTRVKWTKGASFKTIADIYLKELQFI